MLIINKIRPEHEDHRRRSESQNEGGHPRSLGIKKYLHCYVTEGYNLSICKIDFAKFVEPLKLNDSHEEIGGDLQ